MELWGGQAKQNAEQREDVGDKILDVLAGDKGKKQKEKAAQKDWFANKVGLSYTFHLLLPSSCSLGQRDGRWGPGWRAQGG